MDVATERLYYRDSYLREFTARALDARRAGDLTYVVLDRTAFYPEGGGQPWDLGTLGGLPVVSVVDEDGQVVHRVKGALPEGEMVGLVDWERRFDHMQQHTGQHILSQAFLRLLGAETVSFHLGADYASIDLSVPSLEAGQVEEVEELSNRVVFENRPVLIHILEPSELEKFDLRKATGRTDKIRVSEVQGFDSIPCGGTHCRSTAEIGLIKITRWERRSGNSRVEFLCGGRALRDYRRKNEALLSLSAALSVKDSEVAGAVERVVREGEEARRRSEQLRNQLLDHQAREMAEGAERVGEASVVVVLLEEYSAEELKHLAGKLVAVPGRVALLASAPEKVHLLFARSEDVALDAGKLLREASAPFGGRGGGRPNQAQGGIPNRADVRAVLDGALSSVRGLLQTSDE